MRKFQTTGLFLFAIWILEFGIYLKFGACDLFIPIHPE
jgi:hypothetical protein